MKIGTYYYPEQWPRNQWTRDFDNIAKHGFQIVHMAEFAWFSMEPAPGDIRLTWLDECVMLAAERGLKVILCTPTAAPPIWLARDFPETLPIENGVVKDFGGRRHYSPTSPALREATARIVTAMAERFGNHPAIIGWQIDNEFGQTYSTNDHTHHSFQQWLTRKYQTIDRLNEAWGCAFWNTQYTAFDQIRMPASREPRYANPHQHQDAARFWSWALADFCRLQCDILRPHIGDRFLTTNFMPFHLDLNPADCRNDLSLFSWDSYPVTGWEKNPTDETYRIADPNGISLMHDHMASFTGRYALMEVQPGMVNWTGVPVHVYPGAIRLWLWTAFAHGAEFITVYRWRRPRFGMELFHEGLVTTDGVTLSQGGREFVQVIEEMKRFPAVEEAPHVHAGLPQVGIIIDYEQLWSFKTMPQAKQWDAVAMINALYGAVARLGLPVKILHPEMPWPGDLKLIIAPALQLVDQSLIDRLDHFAAGGGHLLLTCRTALMNREAHLWEGPTAAPIVPLIGATIDSHDGMPEGHSAHVEFDGKSFRWGAWGDLVLPAEGTRVLGRYADQFYVGTAAITQKLHGSGVVTYCGVAAEAPLYDALIESLAKQAKLPVTVLLNRVHVVQRDGLSICLNYQDQAIDVPAPANAAFIIGDRRIGPAGVAVWK